MKLRNTAGLTAFFLLPALVLFGCSAANKPNIASSGLIATPVSYYSTAKGRLLGERYKRNLENMVERVVRGPKTVALQFANNIASVGGIGFFTHSAATLPDERYLEIVLAAPELFETPSDAGSKLDRLFSQYGYDLLGVLAGDTEIFEDRDVSGYGLNLSWRTLSNDPGGPKVVVERAVAYFSKGQARAFLRREMNQADLFKNAIVFAGAEDGSMALVSVQAQELAVDFRPTIIEENLASGVKVEPKLEAAKVPPPAPVVAMPERPKIPTMPTPEKVERASAPSEPMIVVMKPEPADKIEAPVGSVPPVALPTAVPEPKMPSPGRAPESARVTAPLIVMVPLPAPAKAEAAALGAETAAKMAPTAAMERAEERPVKVAPAIVQNQVETKAVPAPTPKSDNPPAASRSEVVAANKRSLATPRQQAALVDGDSRSESAPAAKNDPVAKAEALTAPASLPGRPAAVKSTSVSQPVEKQPTALPVEKRELPAAAEVALKLQPSAAISEGAPASPPTPVVLPESVAPSSVTTVVPKPRVNEPLAETPKPPTASPNPVPAVPPSSAAPKPEAVQAAPQQLALSAPRNNEAPVQEPRVRPATPTSVPTTLPPGPERMASLPKSDLATPDPGNLARPAPKVLSGYIVQIAFSDVTAAQRWAERMERKGFAVSVTEAGEAGAVRVRFGNFTVRADAERQLTTLRQEGLRGIVLNLPQGFRPETPSAVQ